MVDEEVAEAVVVRSVVEEDHQGVAVDLQGAEVEVVLEGEAGSRCSLIWCFLKHHIYCAQLETLMFL